MANVEKVSVALTPEQLAVVREAVESGEYASSSEVLREALREWKRRRALARKDVEELRRLWEEGLASGLERHADMAAIKAETRRRLVAAKTPRQQAREGSCRRSSARRRPRKT